MKQPTVHESLIDTAVDHRHERPPPSHVSPFTGDVILSPATVDPISEASTRPKLIRSTSVDPRLIPVTIPPTHSNRTLVLCFDGTGDQFDDDNSNIVSFVSLLKRNDKSKQMVYYQVRVRCNQPATNCHLRICSEILRCRQASEHTRLRRWQPP